MLAPSFGSALAAGDVNGDGRLDILFLTGDFEVSVLPGAGGGTFGPEIRSPLIGASPRPLVVIDVNGDGKPDLAVSNQFGGVSIALGNGDGTFRPSTTFPISGGFFANGIAAADLNRDGRVDLIATNPGGPELFQGSTVSVLLGRGDGTFGPATDFAVGTTPQGVVATDVNGDGNIDVVVGNVFGQGVSVLLGQGDGTFLPKTDYSTEAFPGVLVAADLDNDSDVDVAVCAAPAGVSLFGGRGDGTLDARQDLDVGGACGSIVAADFNRDGRQDLALTHQGSISILLNTSRAADATAPAVTASASPSLLWPANGKTIAVVVSGRAGDAGTGLDLSSGRFAVTDEYGIVQPAGRVTIAADGTYSVAVPLVASRRGDDRDGRRYTIVITVKDRAGNEGMASALVVVPHDRGRQ